MADIGGVIGEIAPDMTGWGGKTVSIITLFVLAIVILALIGIIVFLIIRHLKFRYKIVVFEKINGRFEPTRKDKAMELKLGATGDSVFYLAKHKKYLPTPTIQTGRRTFWFFIREDNEWINFGPGDFDEQSKELGAKFLDKEMRYARTQIQRALKERYDQPGFWKQYGMMILSIVYIAVIGIMIWLSLDKFIDIMTTSQRILDASAQTMERADTIISALNNICTGGSGLVSV